MTSAERDRAVIVAAMVWRDAWAMWHAPAGHTTAQEQAVTYGVLIGAERGLAAAVDAMNAPPEKRAGCTCPTCHP